MHKLYNITSKKNNKFNSFSLSFNRIVYSLIVIWEFHNLATLEFVFLCLSQFPPSNYQYNCISEWYLHNHKCISPILLLNCSIRVMQLSVGWKKKTKVDVRNRTKQLNNLCTPSEDLPLTYSNLGRFDSAREETLFNLTSNLISDSVICEKSNFSNP